MNPDVREKLTAVLMFFHISCNSHGNQAFQNNRDDKHRNGKGKKTDRLAIDMFKNHGEEKIDDKRDQNQKHSEIPGSPALNIGT